ncbi:hypothetical protein A8H39_00200 [Paraburkholderia fungorum]|nr:hypothetical protein A8H39_00200 [Paraburkholderia fungorum]
MTPAPFVSFEEFATYAAIQRLVNHGRAAAVRFLGRSLGFVDALAHDSEMETRFLVAYVLEMTPQQGVLAL